MNKLNTIFVLIILLIPFVLHSQWRTSSGSNKFDGNYKKAIVVGSGGEWPYRNPTLNIINWNDKSLNVYISNIRYTGCSDPSIDITFNNTEEIYSFEATPSTDNDAAFINFNSITYSKYHKTLSMEELFELLKNKNKVHLRYSDSCGNEDYEFSLIGSTKAIDYVEKEYLEKERIRKEEEKELALYRAEIARKEQEEKELLKQEKELLKLEKARLKLETTMNDKSKFDKAKFQKELFLAFDPQEIKITEGQYILKTLLNFKFVLPTEIMCCSMKFRSGAIVKNKNVKFLSSDELTIYNRLKDNCILITDGNLGNTNTVEYYLDIDDLLKNTYNPKIYTIKEKWPELVKLSSQN